MRPAGPVATHVAEVDAEFPRAGTQRGRGDRPATRCRALRAPGMASGATGAARASGCRRGIAACRCRLGCARGGTSAGPSSTRYLMRMNSAPTASICPTSPPSANTVPARGRNLHRCLVGHHVGQRLVLGDRVARLDMPGDQFDLGDAFAEVGHLDDVLAHLKPPSHARTRPRPVPGQEVCPFQGVRIGRVPAGHALDRRLKVVEAVFRHQCHQFCAEAAGACGLVHDDATPGLLHRFDQRAQVERPQATQVDDLGIDATLARRRLADVHHRAVRQRRQVAPARTTAAESSGTV